MTPGGPDAALELVAGLLDESVALAATDPRVNYAQREDECAALNGAIPKRRREFAAGRAAARMAMVRLGLPEQAIPMGEDRAPVWPDGLLGSISHTPDACLAAVARDGDKRLLGLDLEPDVPLDPELWPIVCTPAERDWLDDAAEPARAAKLIFCAKESAYKAQYPRSRTLIDFHAIEVLPDTRAGTFTARFRRPVPPFRRNDPLEGRFAAGNGLIATVVTDPG